MKEIWKPVPSLPGYMASNDGRLLLPPRNMPMPHGGFRRYLPEPTLGSVCRSRKEAAHVYYGVWARGVGNIKVHQAVCEAFHGAKPFSRAVVIHLDENGLNNRSENLKWGTQKENLNAAGFVQYCKLRLGNKSPTVINKARKRDSAIC